MVQLQVLEMVKLAEVIKLQLSKENIAIVQWIASATAALVWDQTCHAIPVTDPAADRVTPNSGENNFMWLITY